MEKYEPLGVVGEGSYGVVLKCRHRESGRSVAIKKFIDSEDDVNVRKIALREIRCLRKLRHENLVNLLEVFRRRKHLYLVFEFIDHTLLDELEGKNKGLEPEIARKYVYQILRGLGFCHDNNIIHRDVKPENVLVSKNGIVKLCDFGFARNLCGPGEQLTDYVATRWYRAPELLVGDVAYGKEVDIWAVGCLFSEMMSGEPLFPGDSDIDQLFLIGQCLGRLARRHLSIMSRNSAFRGFQFPKSRHGSTASTDSMSTAHAKLAKLDSGSRHSSNSKNGKGSGGGGGARRPTPAEKSVFAELFPGWSDETVSFLTLCLDPEPSGRPGCNGLLRLPYFTHDNFPSRYINELNQKLQLEGRHPIPAYSTRKKRSVLGTLQHGANVVPLSLTQHSQNVSHLTKKNPMYQGRLNLSDEPSTTKYSDTFLPNASNLTPTTTTTTTVQKTPKLTKPSQIENNATSTTQPQQPYKFASLTRDQTFLVDRGGLSKGITGDKGFQRRNGEFFSNQETRIPSLLNRKYSDDSLHKSGPSSNPFTNGTHNNPTSKSTPNIVAEGNILPHQPQNKEKRFSIPSNPSQQQPTSFSQTSQPRKFSYSFPPPDNNNAKEQRDHHQQNNNMNGSSYMKDFADENLSVNGGGGIGSKIFQPLPVTTLTFSLGSQNGGVGGYHHHPYSLSVAAATGGTHVKSPNPSYLNVSSYNNASSQPKRTPSPTQAGRAMMLKNNNADGNNSNNSSYFPHTHFSTNGNPNSNPTNNNNGVRYPVSFYQGNPNNFNAKSLPVTVFGSSMILKNHIDFSNSGGSGGGETSMSFLPRVTGKTFTSSGGSVKDAEDASFASNYPQSGTNSLPRRRDSMMVGKWGEQQPSSQPQIKNGTFVSKTITKLNGYGDQLSTTNNNNSNPRHFSTS